MPVIVEEKKWLYHFLTSCRETMKNFIIDADGSQTKEKMRAEISL